MTEPAPPLVHATCVAFEFAAAEWTAALFLGPSGSGKSDLALRLIHEKGPAECRLVADDYVHVVYRGSRLVASPPAAIRGKLEVRGLGVVDVPFVDEARLVVSFRLVPRHEVMRLPDPQAIDLAALAKGFTAPCPLTACALAAFDSSAAAKVVLTTRRMAAAKAEGGR